MPHEILIKIGLVGVLLSAAIVTAGIGWAYERDRLVTAEEEKSFAEHRLRCRFIGYVVQGDTEYLAWDCPTGAETTTRRAGRDYKGVIATRLTPL